MAFVDELTITAKAGNGGNGVVAWHRFKYIAKGGPAGGDGGKGGDIYFRAIRDITKLAEYTAKPKFVAENGIKGSGSSKAGLGGNDLYIGIPIGSVVTHQETGEEFQLLQDGDTRLVLKGGDGGFGNEHFKSSRNVSPEEQTNGKMGEEGTFYIELQLIVDLGLVGLPSAGKSSLLNALTRAQAKVGAYPFTTLTPNLGDLFGYIIADIPGLIEGASEGKGLGHKFLRHIKRTKGLAHLVGLDSEDPVADYEGIRKELGNYSKDLLDKPELIILSKSDVVTPEVAEKTLKLFKDKYNKEVIVTTILDDTVVKQTADSFVEFIKKLR